MSSFSNGVRHVETSIDRALARLAVELSSAATVDQSISMVTSFAAHALGTHHAGATLSRRGGRRFETAGPTDEVVAAADRLQNELGEGPCIDATRQSRTIVSRDVAADARWPRWGVQAAAMGLGSILSSDMRAGDHRIGALNVYGENGHEFSRDDQEVALLLAHHAAAALVSAETVEGLTKALDTRTVIGQAQGVLMERYGLDADRAFAVLRRHSQNENIRLVDLARSLVDDGARPDRQG